MAVRDVPSFLAPARAITRTRAARRRKGAFGGAGRGTAAITLTLILLYVTAQIGLAVWAGRGAKSDAD